MARYVALFRGINVGKAKRIAMADLRTLLALREPLYASADHTINTSGRTVKAIVSEAAAKTSAPR